MSLKIMDKLNKLFAVLTQNVLTIMDINEAEQKAYKVMLTQCK